MKRLMALFMFLASCAPADKKGDEKVQDTFYIQRSALELLKEVRANSTWTSGEICTKAQKRFFSEHYGRYFFPAKWSFRAGKAFSCELVVGVGERGPQCISDGRLSNGIGIFGSESGVHYDLEFVTEDSKVLTTIDLYPQTAFIEGTGRLDKGDVQDVETMRNLLSTCSFP